MTTRTPASLAEHIALYHPALPVMPPLQSLAFQLSFCIERAHFFTEQARLLQQKLLKEASGATVSTSPNASAQVPPPPLPKIYSGRCLCPLGRTHLPDCSWWQWAQSKAQGGGSGATASTGAFPLQSASNASSQSHHTSCSPTFCLKGWRGQQQCSSVCSDSGRNRAEEAERAATFATLARRARDGVRKEGAGATEAATEAVWGALQGQFEADRSAEGARVGAIGRALPAEQVPQEQNKPPGVIINTPPDSLSEEGQARS